jgi:hypothetical protein
MSDTLARKFHAAYERLAPAFGYATRHQTRTFDAHSANGRLMIAVCAEVLGDLERERDVARRANALWKSASKIWRRYCSNAYAKLCKLERERDDAVLRREETVMQCELLASDMRQWRECAENLIDYARECLASLSGGCGHPYCEREMDTIRKDIARYERLKEGGK